MHLQIDPVGGLAGDMFVAAMLDAFPALEAAVQAAVRAAGLPERFRCELLAHADHAITGKRFLVSEGSKAPGDNPAPGADHAHDHEHGHQPFSVIRERLVAAPLDPGVRGHALAVFTLLAEAEAEVHGATIDGVTFHELGEWDSIADIIAAAAIIESCPGATWFVGPLPLGSGFANSAHGRLPVPAPAATLLLRGLVVRDDGIGGERVTPTGAAIARHLMSLPGKPPRARRVLSTGVGFGTRTLLGIGNFVRVIAFEREDAAGVGADERVTAIEFEVDDQTPEDLAIALDHIRAHLSVLDATQMAVFGKKGRMMVAVRVLCRPEAEDAVAGLCFDETTTLGLRLVDTRRRTLSRVSRRVPLDTGPVDAKSARRPSGAVTTKVEARSLKDTKSHAARRKIRRLAENIDTE